MRIKNSRHNFRQDTTVQLVPSQYAVELPQRSRRRYRFQDFCGFDPRLEASKPFGILLAISMQFGMVGCAVGPDYSGPPETRLPSQWSNATVVVRRASKLDRWWLNLGDPLLSQLIDEAVDANLSVAKAIAAVREARATREQTTAGLFPTASGSASVTNNKASAGTSSTGGSSSPYNLYKSGFDASWELDLFGRLQRGVEAAYYAEEAAENDLRNSLVTLIGDVAAYYVDARGYQARIALAQRTATSQRETERLTRSKYDAGSAAAMDLAKATAQAASTEANVPSYQASLAASLHRLGILLGRPPGALWTLLARSGPVPTPRLPLPSGIPADILDNRPDVASAERKLAQATAKIGQAEADRYPTVSLAGSLATSALSLGDLAKYSTMSWSVGPSITVPVFDAGKRYAAVRVTEAQRDQAFATFHATLLTALEDVENALVSLSTERVRASKLSTAVKNYRDAARLSRSLFENGSAGFLDVLDAERSLYSAEDSLIASRVLIAKNYISLAKALGGGWVEPVDTSRPLVVDENTGPHLRVPIR